jgi:hypothetical protein
MQDWSVARRVMLMAVVAAAVYAAWVFGSRSLRDRRWRSRQETPKASANAELERLYGGTAVKILQFYAREGNLTEGGKSVICYGVVNAKSVRIEPPVDGVFVALNRCVGVAPDRDTRYTLTAEGTDGRTVSESFLLSVHPDAETLPKITSFRIAGRQLDYRGRTVFSVSFAVKNADTIEIDPPAFPTLHGAPNGQFYVAPEKSTTYTLTVTNKRGHKAQQQLTLEVPAR